MDLDEKFRNIENQLVPILSTPLNPETTQSDQLVVQDFHRNLDYMNKLVSAEMASSKQPPHTLARIGKRVVSLQKAAHAWTEGRPLNPSVNSSGSSPCSLIESCLTDDDGGYYYNGEVSGVAGFKVYENSEFVGDSGDDDDDGHDRIIDTDQVEETEGDGEDQVEETDTVQDEGQESEAGNNWVEEINEDDEEGIVRVAEQDEEQESEPGNDGVEKEVIKVDYQKEQNSEEDDDDEEEEEEGTKNCCYKIIFWGLMVVMGAISFKVGFLDFPYHYAPEMLLTPT